MNYWKYVAIMMTALAMGLAVQIQLQRFAILDMEYFNSSKYSAALNDRIDTLEWELMEANWEIILIQHNLKTEQAVCQRSEAEILEILGDDNACPSPYDACQPLIDIYLAACTPYKDQRNLKP